MRIKSQAVWSIFFCSLLWIMSPAEGTPVVENPLEEIATLQSFPQPAAEKRLRETQNAAFFADSITVPLVNKAPVTISLVKSTTRSLYLLHCSMLC